MASEDSDDEFLSADEYVSDHSEENEKIEVPVKSDSEKQDTPVVPEPEDFNIPEPALENLISTTEIKSYRKRPERTRKTSPPKPLLKTQDLMPIIDIVKVARPEAIVSNLTSLTSNISKGFASLQLQEASSNVTTSIKGLVLGSETKTSSKFVYDDNRLGEKDTEEEESPIAEKSRTREADGQEKATKPDLLGAEIRSKKEIIEQQSEGSSEVKETENQEVEAIKEQGDQFEIEESLETNSEVKSSITDEISKLSEAFEKLKQTHLEEEQPIHPAFAEDDFDDFCENLDKIHRNMSNQTIVPSQSNPVKETTEGMKEASSASDPVSQKNDDISVGESIPAAPAISERTLEETRSFTEEPEKSPEPSDQNKSGVRIDSENVVDEGWDDWGNEEDIEVPDNEPTVDANLSEEVSPQKETIAHIQTEQNVNENLDKSKDKSFRENLSQPRDVCQKESGENSKPLDKSEQKPPESDQVEGWDDWGNDSGEEVADQNTKDPVEDGWDDWGDFGENSPKKGEKTKEREPEKVPDDEVSGWDDWGDDDVADMSPKKEQVQMTDTKPSSSEPEWKGWRTFGQQKEEKGGGWGGWGTSLLSTATSNLSAVTQGLSNVIETGLGVPDPLTMARIQVEERKTRGEELHSKPEEDALTFPFSNIVSGVGKIVEVAKVQEIGSRVLSGGLDTLETIGKKTMQVLQEGDPGLKKKRALLAGKGQLLSEVLKDARDRAIAEEKQARQLNFKTRCNFETLFDDYHGLVHLEALEMLSRQCQLRLEQIQQTMPPAKLRELRETMDEVNLLCELDDDFDENDDFKVALTDAAGPLEEQLSIEKILEVHERISDWLLADTMTSPFEMYDHVIRTTAELTSAVTSQYHKSGELLLLKERRKTVQEADALLQLTSTICAELLSISSKVTEKMNTNDEENVDTLVGNLKQEIDNAVSYIKQAFTLLVPVLQLGAT